jgi:hypothetical protein
MSLVDLGCVPRHAPRSTRAEFDAVLYREKHRFAGAAALNELLGATAVNGAVSFEADSVPGSEGEDRDRRFLPYP